MKNNKTNTVQTMTEVTDDALIEIDGGMLSWCEAFFIAGAAGFAGGLTGGAGALVGAEIGHIAGAIYCN